MKRKDDTLIARAFRFLVCGILLAQTGALSAQIERNTAGHDPSLRGLADKTIVAGLNNGLRKIYLRVAPDGIAVSCDMRMRKIGSSEDLAKEEYTPVGVIKNLLFMGIRHVQEDGNDWNELHFNLKNGPRQVMIARDIKSVGKVLLDHFKKYSFDVDSEHLPYVIAIVQDKADGPKMIYPLRDLSVYPDPMRALLDDIVPFERGADLQPVVDYLIERLLAAKGTDRLRWIERIAAFETKYLTSAQSILIGLRDDADKAIADAARKACTFHAFFSQQEVEAACRGLESNDVTEQRRGALLLRDVGPSAARTSRPALEKYLAKKDAAPEVTAIVKTALDRLAQAAESAGAPASRPASGPARN